MCLHIGELDSPLHPWCEQTELLHYHQQPCKWNQGENSELELKFPLTVIQVKSRIGNLSTDVFQPRTATGNWIFPFWNVFMPSHSVTSSHSNQQWRAYPETFHFRLPSVAHKRLFLSSLILSQWPLLEVKFFMRKICFLSLSITLGVWSSKFHQLLRSSLSSFGVADLLANKDVWFND